MRFSDSRVPVITHADELNIPWQTLQTIIAGRSLIDTQELHITSLDEAQRFLQAYGMESDDEAEKLRLIALDYIDSVLLVESHFGLPCEVKRLTLPELLMLASAPVTTQRSQWACVVLKVCHAVAHASWTRDENAYQGALARVKGRLDPYFIDTDDGAWIGDDQCRIPLVEYRLKTEKHFFRLVTKLLLKEGNLSSGIYDHIGMRFVTHDIFAAILLIRFLRSRHVFMYANLLPQESKNSLAEFNEIEAMFAQFSGPIEGDATAAYKSAWPAATNHYSSREFQMIKIVERILVTTGGGRKVFFPCEIQILTQKTHALLQRKKMNHATYEKRQVKGVRRRLLRGTSLADSG